MIIASFLQPLAPMLSAVLAALFLDILSCLIPAMRDYLPPLLGIPQRMAKRLQNKLNRTGRSNKILMIRGLITVLLLVLLGLILALGVFGLIESYPMIEPVVWFCIFSATKPWRKSKIFIDQRTKNKQTNKDDSSFIRELIQSCVLSLSYGLWLPLFFAILISGLHAIILPFVVWIMTLHLAAQTILKSNKMHHPYTQIVSVIDTVIGYIPSRIAALLIVIAALFTPKAKPLQAFKLVITQGSWHARSNEGWPMAAMSGALNIALPTEAQPNAWFSAQNASARLDHADLKRALWLHSVTLCLTILILSALVLLSLST